jgi:DNA-binding transcriptional regulator YdaS (Cro superfamily)
MDLFAYLEKTGMSRQKLADFLGICRSGLDKYIMGTRRPTQKKAEMIERLTSGDVTVKDLRGEDARERKLRFSQRGG